MIEEPRNYSYTVSQENKPEPNSISLHRCRRETLILCHSICFARRMYFTCSFRRMRDRKIIEMICRDNYLFFSPTCSNHSLGNHESLRKATTDIHLHLHSTTNLKQSLARVVSLLFSSSFFQHA